MRIKLGCPLRLEAVCESVGGISSMPLPHLQIVTHITTSSKEVETGDLFVALRGESNDGHLYIEEAVARGASLILCQSDYTFSSATPYYIQVKDTFEALAALAKYTLARFPHKTIAVTGSVGKTTTRHFIATLLKTKYRVHESPENYNNLLGVSLTILSAPQDTQYLVLELGMDEKGQISKMSHLIQPDVAVITNIGISHLEKLGSQRAICEAKLEILHGMTDGKLLIEGVDPYLMQYAPDGAITVSANHRGAMCRSTHEVSTAHGITFDYISPLGRWDGLHIPTLGHHTLSCALFAIAVAQTQDVDEISIRGGLLSYVPPYQRQTLIELDHLTILLDAYNACPASMKAGVEAANLIAKAKGAPLCALLGDMMELGQETLRHHEETGTYMASAGVSHLFLLGSMAEAYQKGALSAGLSPEKIYHLNAQSSSKELVDIIRNTLPSNAVLLIKGSRINRLENLLPYFK